MFNMAYYCLFKFGWTPSRISSMSKRELAVVAAAIEIYQE